MPWDCHARWTGAGVLRIGQYIRGKVIIALLMTIDDIDLV